MKGWLLDQMAEKLTIRTDLAMESREMAQQGSSQELPGVVVDSVSLKDIKITRVEVTSADGEQRIGKPVGNYITLEVPGIKDRDPEYEERVSKQLAEEIQRLVDLEDNSTILDRKSTRLNSSHVRISYAVF